MITVGELVDRLSRMSRDAEVRVVEVDGLSDEALYEVELVQGSASPASDTVYPFVWLWLGLPSDDVTRRS